MTINELDDQPYEEGKREGGGKDLRGPTPDSEIDPVTWIGLRKTVSPKHEIREDEQPGIINIRTKKLVDRPCR